MIVLIAPLAVTSGPSYADSAASPAGRPNVVVIFADDLGYADLTCFGAIADQTPNLDRMAADGVRFTDFYVAQPVCSASRAALLTGCYPNRVGISGALGPGSRVGINAEETTLAELFKSQGYATAAVGKWHLGDRPQFLPTRHGFDEYFGLPYSNDMWPFHPTAEPGRYPPLPLFDGAKVVDPDVTPDDQRTLTRRYAERAVAFITANKTKPFFLYLAHSMPHVPLYVGEAFGGKTDRGLFPDVIREIDWSVGEVLKTLRSNGLDDNTLVIFTSDNGPWLSYGNHAGSAAPLREGKGTVWDGGVREPFIARWPGTIPAGTVQREPAMTIDLLPTLAGVIGAALPDRPIDGKDIFPLLRCEPGEKSPHDAYFFYYKANELQAVRSGPWKLVLPHAYRTMNGQPPGRDGKPGQYRMITVQTAELYDLAHDPGERHDLAARYPDVVRRLQAHAETARDDLGDALTGRPGAGRRPAGVAQQ